MVRPDHCKDNKRENIRMATEFQVYLEDRPGTLAELTEALAGSAIRIVAMHATPCPKRGVVQFVTDNTDETAQALNDAGIDYNSREVLIITLPGEAGALARLARALGNARINIDSLYIAMNGQIVLDASDLKAAQRIALDLGMQ